MKLRSALLHMAVTLCCTGGVFAQSTPSFLQESRFNRPGAEVWINEHPATLLLREDQSTTTGKVLLQEFSFGAHINMVETWGRGLEFPGVYFEENLPSFFHRRLEFDAFDLPSGRFEWVFTGETGGFTVAVSRDSIWVYQRFYDSYGLNTLIHDTVYLNRHPEKIWAMAPISYTGKLQSIDVQISHNLLLEVHVNGRPAVKQLILHDVAEHQLRCSDTKSNTRGRVYMPATGHCAIQIEPQVRYQKILGFGGIGIPTAYRALSKEGKTRWWEIIREYNLLLHREYPIGQKLNPSMDNWDNIEDATVHYYGDNFPNSEISDFEYIHKLQDMGGLSIFEFWKFPPWVQPRSKKEHVFDLSRAPSTVDIQAYVHAMVAYCRTAEKKTGRPPDIVGIQNEQTQTAETWHRMTRSLRHGLDTAGYSSVKMHMHNASQLHKGIQAAEVFASDPHTWKFVDYAASNMYDYQNFFTDPDGYDTLLTRFRHLTADKPFLSTELSVNRPFYQIKSYRIAFQMGQLYHKNLTLANASAIMYCWTLLNNVQYTYDMTRSLFGVDRSNGFVPASFGYQERVFGAFSRYILKGMTRIGCTSGDPDILCSAFQDEEGSKTLIIMSRSIQPVLIDSVALGDYHYMETATYYDRNAAAPIENTLMIQPGEIVTLTSVSKAK